jgi:hypothetical protein
MPNTKQAPLPMMPNNNLPKLNLFPIDKGYLKGTIYPSLPLTIFNNYVST